MTKLFRLLPILLLLPFLNAKAQSFRIHNDTTRYSTPGYYSILNNITNNTAADITLRWNVLESNFPEPLQLKTCVCDNVHCNIDSNMFKGRFFNSVYAPGMGEMHLLGDITDLPVPGPYYVTLVFVNRDLPSDADTTTFIINRDVLGVSVVAANKGLSVFPNPAVDNVTLAIEAEKNVDASIRIDNLLGQPVYQSTTQLSSGSNSIHVPLRDIAAGNYHVVVTAGNNVIVRQLTIAK